MILEKEQIENFPEERRKDMIVVNIRDLAKKLEKEVFIPMDHTDPKRRQRNLVDSRKMIFTTLWYMTPEKQVTLNDIGSIYSKHHATVLACIKSTRDMLLTSVESREKWRKCITIAEKACQYPDEVIIENWCIRIPQF